MEVFDLRSGAAAVFFLAIMVNLVLLGWRSTPERSSPVQRRRKQNAADDSKAA